MGSPNTKTVLRNAAKGKSLTGEEKKVLKKLITVLKKALKGKSLSDDDKTQINEIIEKSKAGTLTAADLITLCRNLFHLWDIFGDYS
jgi:hypothetical protein